MRAPHARPPTAALNEQEKLPSAKQGGGEPIPEGLLWLLMTGDVRRGRREWRLGRQEARRSPAWLRLWAAVRSPHARCAHLACSSACLPASRAASRRCLRRSRPRA